MDPGQDLRARYFREMLWQQLDFLWHALGCTARELQHDVCQCNLTAYAYVKNELFELFDNYPWILTQGDIAANVAYLASERNRVYDPATSKLKKRLDRGTTPQTSVAPNPKKKQSMCNKTILISAFWPKPLVGAEVFPDSFMGVYG